MIDLVLNYRHEASTTLTANKAAEILSQNNFPMLTQALSTITKPADALVLLAHELRFGQRYSYVTRIYGRYRKLVAQYDLEILCENLK